MINKTNLMKMLLQVKQNMYLLKKFKAISAK